MFIYSAASKAFLFLGDYNCDLFIPKPFDLDELIQGINSLLPANESLALAYFFVGTFAPSFFASDKPMAIACFFEVTFLPVPVFSVPSFFSCMAFSTFSPAFAEYFAIIVILSLGFKW